MRQHALDKITAGDAWKSDEDGLHVRPWPIRYCIDGDQMLRPYKGQETCDKLLSYCNKKELGDSLTVEQRTLTPLVKVRILVPQPTKSEA